MKDNLSGILLTFLTMCPHHPHCCANFFNSSILVTLYALFRLVSFLSHWVWSLESYRLLAGFPLLELLSPQMSPVSLDDVWNTCFPCNCYIVLTFGNKKFWELLMASSFREVLQIIW